MSKALQSVAVGLLDEHLHHCVAEAVTAGGPDAEEKLAEATAAVQRLLRS
ncbi:MAG TPA: metal-sensing transcriptional repressor [Acidimicrobiales bacterium]